MKVYYTWFYSPDRLDFPRMRNVFDYSLRKYNPDIEIEEEKASYPPETKGQKPAHFENIYKLKYWNNAVQKAKEPIVLMDCDMMVIGNIKNILDNPGDVVFTTRNYSTVKTNAGVVLVRPTDMAKEFFREWLRVSVEDFNLENYMWLDYIKEFKGATQSTLAYLRDKGKFEDIIGEMPCPIWNCAALEWNRIKKDTKIIHVKSQLRNLVLANQQFSDLTKEFDKTYIWPLMERFYKFEQELRDG